MMVATLSLASRSVTDHRIRNATEHDMRLDEIQFDVPAFSQPDAVRLCRVNAATLDNWLRYEHVPTVRSDTGVREFAFRHLLKIDCIENLTTLFKMPPKVAGEFADRAVNQYRHGFASDLAELASGAPWPRAVRDLDAHFTFARDGDDVVELESGDERSDSVMMVFPTRMIARRLIANIRDDAVIQARTHG